jgi:hypothetical protein
MKKYLWIVALIAALTMVFVGCGDGDDSGGGGDVTISFSWNTPAGYGGPALTTPDPVKPASGAAIGTLPAAPSGTVDFGLVFKGWFDAATGGTQVTAASKFTKSATVYAQWESFDPLTQVPITFNFNYPDAPPSIVRVATIGAALGDANWPAEPSRPGNVVGNLTNNDTWAFTGWYQYENGTGDDYTSETVMPGQIIDNTVWAKWAPKTGFPTETPPAGTDLARAEKIILQNGNEAAFYFTLPAGKTWSDYSGISADYLIGDNAWIAENGVRTHRLFGNYKLSDFSDVIIPDNSSANLPNGFIVANLNNYNAPYIIHQVTAAWSSVETFVNTELGLDAKPWEWFTINYDITGTKGHSGFLQENLPAAGATGPLYFCLGFTKAGAPGTTQWIRDVTLIGNTGTDSVIAKPLYIKDGNNVYPAFMGYPTTTGNGTEENFRAMADGSAPPTVDKP